MRGEGSVTSQVIELPEGHNLLLLASCPERTLLSQPSPHPPSLLHPRKAQFRGHPSCSIHCFSAYGCSREPPFPSPPEPSPSPGQDASLGSPSTLPAAFIWNQGDSPALTSDSLCLWGRTSGKTMAPVALLLPSQPACLEPALFSVGPQP